MVSTPASGLLIIDKPPGMTSHDVVSRVRRLAGTRRVGHAGTLDPAATGVLLVGVERATRLLTHLVGAEKEYVATLRLGVSTHTDDAEGEVTSRRDASHLDRTDVERSLAALTGEIDQVPSSVSAKKVGGRRAHALVRAGEEVELAPRRVRVSVLEVLDVRTRVDDDPGGTAVLDVDVRTVVSSGTYVRALARDAGQALGVGGSLTSLRRTRVAGYGVTAAVQLDQLATDGVGAHLVDLAAAAGAVFTTLGVGRSAAHRLAMGQRVALEDLAPAPEPVETQQEQLVAVTAPGGALVALVRLDDRVARPVLVFAGPTDVP